MKLHVITHVYCPPGLEHYANALVWHFGSLCAHPGSKFESIHLHVCCSQDDTTTKQTIYGLGGLDIPSNVRVWDQPMVPELLFRRAFARNYLALQQESDDVVWFADCDYFVGTGFLDAIHDHFANV